MGYIKNARTSGAQGPDGIPIVLIKKEPAAWGAFLAPLFNFCFRTINIPSSWKGSIIVSLYKKGPKSLPTSFRQIALLDASGKLFAKSILCHLQQWANDQNILPPEQAGFRKNHGTLDNIAVVQTIVEKYTFSQSMPVYTAFIDFSTAFDKVDRQTLWRKLHHLGMPHHLLGLLIELHTDTWCQVMMGGPQGLSCRIETDNGLKQGCLLGPLLFSLYIYDLQGMLNSMRGDAPRIGTLSIGSLLYADDVAIFDLTPIGLQRQLDALTKYAEDHFLKINISKILIFRKKGHRIKKGYKWLLRHE